MPPGVPPARGILKTAFSLRYQDIHIGTGVEAEPNKIYKVNYTGWLAADGHKFDSSYDHKMPVMEKDGKPEMDADGKPKESSGEPISFPQGFGRVIPGFDQGFTGMKIGGKRRLFIPWQLAYGSRGSPGPNAANPGIPPKADLIFDIELVDVSEMPAPPVRPAGMGTGPNGQPMRMMPRPGPPSPHRELRPRQEQLRLRRRHPRTLQRRLLRERRHQRLLQQRRRRELRQLRHRRTSRSQNDGSDDSALSHRARLRE